MTGSTPRNTRIASAIIWKPGLAHTLEPVQVTLGITDHAYTEVTAVLKGNLSANDAVVTAAIAAKASASPGTP